LLTDEFEEDEYEEEDDESSAAPAAVEAEVEVVDYDALK
jgi:hypothetical protein